MILDALWLFTGGSGGVGNNDGLTDSPTTGTQNSSNIIDLAGPALPPSGSTLGGTPGRDLGIGDDPALKLMVLVTTTFTGGTSLQIGFAGAPDNGSGSPGAYTTFAFGGVITEATMIAGVRLFDIDYPRTNPLAPEPPRFVRLSYVTVGTHTAGKIEGLVVVDRFDQIINVNNFPSGYPAGVVIAN
jgi:hypothetical protein